MNDAKYIGLDVHQATVSVAALDSTGKLAESTRLRPSWRRRDSSVMLHFAPCLVCLVL